MRREQMFLKRRSFLLLLLLLFLFLVIESYLNTMSEAVLVILSPSWAFYGDSGSLKITFFSLFSPYSIPPNTYEVISPCGFGLYFLND